MRQILLVLAQLFCFVTLITVTQAQEGANAQAPVSVPAVAVDQPIATDANNATASDPAEDLFALSLNEVMNLEVSTASKLSTKRTKSPGNMMVVTQDQIRRYGYRNVAEALQRVVGFLTNKLGTNTLIGYRGLSPQSFTSNSRLLVLIDGVRYNEWNYDQSSLAERFPLDIESVDRIEVLKGAGYATWGSNALFAVINVISKSSGSERATQALVESQSNNRQKTYMSVGNVTAGGLKYYASGSATGETGDVSAYYPAFESPPDISGTTREDYKQKSYRANMKLSYDEFYSNTVFGYNDEFLGSGVDYIYGDGGTSDYHDIPLRSEVGYRSNVFNQDEGELLVRSYYMLDKNRSIFKYPSFTTPDATTNYRLTSQTQSGGAEIRYSQKISEQVKALVGTEYVRIFENPFHSSFNDILSDGTSMPFEGEDDYTKQSIHSYFSDLMYSPLEQVTLFAGARLDQFSGLDPIFGPRLSLIYNPDQLTTLRLVYSQGLRNPSIGERFTADGRTDKIKAEDLRYYEAFAERQVTDWLGISTSLFYSDLSNTIGFAGSTESGGSTYENTAGFTSRGVEIEARAQIDNEVQAYANLTYAQAKDIELAESIKSFPHTIARSGFSFGENQGLLVVSPELMFIGSTESASGKTFNPYITANLTLISYPASKGFNVSASVYNIFDKDYARLVGSNPTNIDSERATEMGREYRLQAKWDF